MLLLAKSQTPQTMKSILLLLRLSSLFFLCTVWCMAPALGQAQGRTASAATSGQGSQPVSYASMTQLNGMLTQLEASSSNTQSDLAKLRIERWKTDNATKKQMLANIDSVQRNLQGALPEIIAQLRGQPEDLPTTFKLYRNLDALYDVVGTVAEGTGAFGSKDDFQALSNDLNGFEGTRKQLAQRIESLSSAKEAEIVRLRTDLKTAQAAIPATPPKKIVIDDNEPPKKPVVKKKKPVAKPAPPTTTTPPGQAPPAQTPAKPQ
jgi:TolA-binding protein